MANQGTSGGQPSQNFLRMPYFCLFFAYIFLILVDSEPLTALMTPTKEGPQSSLGLHLLLTH